MALRLVAAPPRTLWVDVTTLTAWKGKLTGIPRTWVCLLQQWLAHPAVAVRLCRLDPSCQAFVEFPPQEFRDWLATIQKEAPQLQAEPPPPPAPPVSRMTAIRRRIKTWLKVPYHGVLRRLPPTVRDLVQALVHVPRCTCRLFERVPQKLWEIVHPPRPMIQPEPPRPEPLALTAEDVVFAPGVSWIVPDYGLTVWRLKQRQGFRFVPLVYDLIPCKFPQFFGPGMCPGFQAWVADMLWCADLIVTISENSRNDLAAFAKETGAPLPPVEVIRLGDDMTDAAPAAVPPALPHVSLDDGFVLSVGTVEVRKNHLLLYHVWRRLLERHGRDAVPPLLIVGGQGWLTGDLLYQITADPETRDKVHVLADVTDAQLLWLYRNCLFTLYPSHYEGWGLPLAEGLGHGKYCVTSGTSSLPEIGGDLVGYHDPLDVEGCLALVARALFDADFRREKEEEIRRRYRRCSWGECAANLLGALDRRLGRVVRKEAA